MDDKRLGLAELRELIVAVLVTHDTAPANAESTANALVAAEADGQQGHGASRVPSYAGQSRSGKVDGHAEPELIELDGPAAIVDAHDGFSYPAAALAERQWPARWPRWVTPRVRSSY